MATATKVEILYFDGCPTYGATEKTLREVLTVQGVEAGVELVAVNTDEEARRLRFPGSPTIMVDGEDLFPIPDRVRARLQDVRHPGGFEGSSDR